MIAHCLRAYPRRAVDCSPGIRRRAACPTCSPTRNVAASAQIYTVDPREHLRIDRAAEAAGQEVIGVFHSHTHTDPYPSPTDVAQAPDPCWHYVLVSLRHEVASVRSYRIVDGHVDRGADRGSLVSDRNSQLSGRRRARSRTCRTCFASTQAGRARSESRERPSARSSRPCRGDTRACPASS